MAMVDIKKSSRSSQIQLGRKPFFSREWSHCRTICNMFLVGPSLSVLTAMLLLVVIPGAAHGQGQTDDTLSGRKSNSDKQTGRPESKDRVSGGRSEEKKKEEQQLPDIVVTGSHIRGAVPVGSPLSVISRQDIDQSGLGTAVQVLHAMPQNFRGGINEEVREGTEYGENAFGGAAVNLRGLGADSTLVLLNGRRMPGSGASGSFVDISMIPLAAIDRIEVLTDGASAVYGADAIAGVVNIMLKERYDGAETRLRYGSVTEGALDEYQLSQSFGASWEHVRLLVNYEFQDRDPLKASDVDRTKTSDMRRFGGDDHRPFYAKPGNILDISTFMPAFAIPAGQNGRSLTVDDLDPTAVNRSDLNTDADINAGQRRHSIYARVNSDLSEKLSVSLDGIFNRRKFTQNLSDVALVLFVPDTNPFFIDPFGAGLTIVAYNLEDEHSPVRKGVVESLLGSALLEYQLSNWEIKTTLSHGREKSDYHDHENIDFTRLNAALADPNPATAFNPFGDGISAPDSTIMSFFHTLTLNRRSEVSNINLIADGPLFYLPSGPLRIAAGADVRRETLKGHELSNGDRQLNSEVDLSRDIYAIFAELAIPILSNDMPSVLIEALDVSLALRMDHYEKIGETFNPKIGATLKVVNGLSIRGSYGTSFRPPNLRELDEKASIALITTLEDPKSPTGFSRVLQVGGNNPDLGNEKSRAWSIGFDIQPAAIRGLNLNATYYDINFRDRIGTPREVGTIMFQENLYPDVIRRSPSQVAIDQFCRSDRFFGDQSECDSGNIAAIVDLRLQNMSKTVIRGIDLGGNYLFPFIRGSASVGINTSYIIDFLEAATERTALLDHVDTLGFPVDFRARGYFSWSRGGVLTAIYLNYIDDYLNDRVRPNEKIEDWLSIDLQISYQTGGNNNNTILNNVTISVSAQNIFDNDPPFVNNSLGYDSSNSSVIGRFIAIEFRKSW